MNFNEAKSIPTLDTLVKDEKETIQNKMVRVLVEKGAILERTDDSGNYEQVKEVVFDQVFCFKDEEELNNFIKHVNEYGS